MDSDKIIQELNQRFAAPLPEFYKRRIIFWMDEDCEFADKLDEITLTNAQMVQLTGSNSFAVKKLIAVDDTTSNLLIYCPLTFERLEDNWLLDVQLYSEEFRADLLSIWMDELRLPSTPAMRMQVKAYRKFLGAKARRDRLAAQQVTPGTPAQLHLAVMAALCGAKEARPAVIIRCVLAAGLDNAANPILQDMRAYRADEAFWAMVRQGTGYAEGEPSVEHLAEHILLTAATRTLRPEFLAGLEERFSVPHQAFCYDLASEWLLATDNDGWKQIARRVEENLHLEKRFRMLAVEDLMNTALFPCVDVMILRKMMTDIGNDVIDVEGIRATVAKRRTCAFYEDTRCYYEGIMLVASMQDFYRNHAEGFHTVEPAKVWQAYTTEYYLMDTWYRQFYKHFAESLLLYNNALHDLFAHVSKKVEGLYCNWFLCELGSNWCDACAEPLAVHGYIPEIAQQKHFYENKIRRAENRVFVIISDAMRFEVAAELAEQLERETQAQVKMDSMQAIFPTITKFGMAALLPNRDLTVQQSSGVLKVFADGQPTDSGYRDGVLKAANTDSVAVKYSDLVNAKSADRRNLVKGMSVVYIYHDTIDATGHLGDSKVFHACDDAITEIKNLVRIICSDLGGANIYITSDHGFLYTHEPLQESDKVDKTSFRGQDIEFGRRYAILEKGAQPAYLLPIKFLGGSTEYAAFAPRENNRIRMNGGGMNFVHGGISLQEMVVPLIDYHYLRNDSKEYQRNKSKYDTKPVEIQLLTASRKVSNLIFQLSFYQKDAVGGNREAATYSVFFTDGDGKIISDTQRIIADKVSENNLERTFRCSFSLKSQSYNKSAAYYLVVQDADGIAVSKEEFQIDIAFATDGFDFFA